ncbi:MAG: hypothetical protein HOM11_13705 [Methylococcales bacterium]|jgi:hypothetical protein|nr:hypothetical protein [Methylococcales bacterium]MBT7444189.1 hypothetical protein [Methylococcales bacterium]
MIKGMILTTALLSLSQFASAETFLRFESDPGDFIGQGQTFTDTEEDTAFRISENNNNTIRVSTDTWSLSFNAAFDAPIEVGSFEDATREPFNGDGVGLSVSGDGRGCNTLTGRFDVLEITRNDDDTINSFSADFEQHCGGGEAALFGSIRVNASAGFAAKVSITANDSNNDIAVSVGEVVNILVTVEAGDDEGVETEFWLGHSGNHQSRWFNGNNFTGFYTLRNWKLNATTWQVQPISDQTQAVEWVASKPGIFTFQTSIDSQPNQKMELESSDHITITVK